MGQLRRGGTRSDGPGRASRENDSCKFSGTTTSPRQSTRTRTRPRWTSSTPIGCTLSVTSTTSSPPSRPPERKARTTYPRRGRSRRRPGKPRARMTTNARVTTNAPRRTRPRMTAHPTGTIRWWWTAHFCPAASGSRARVRRARRLSRGGSVGTQLRRRRGRIRGGTRAGR